MDSKAHESSGYGRECEYVPSEEVLVVKCDETGWQSASFDKVAFYGRTFEEYSEMFALSLSDLSSVSILDCSSGPAAFVATGTNKYHLNITGTDPRYCYAPSHLRAIAQQNISAGLTVVDVTSSLPIKDTEKFKRDKMEAMEIFLQDYEEDFNRRKAAGNAKYVGASLPFLPFEDRSFDLVLCGNFLFIYSGKVDGGLMVGGCSVFDLDFHLKAVTELVCKSELRLTPTCALDAAHLRHKFVVPVVELLTRLGFSVEFVACEHSSVALEAGEVMVAKRKTELGVLGKESVTI